MKILIVGGGGREHALALQAKASASVTEVLVAPGNAGTARTSGLRNVAVAADDVEGLQKLAQEESVALTIIGPEQPLVAGIRDAFDAAGLACFGPHKNAAQLEGSKAFAKDFLKRHGIPTGASETFTDLNEAEAYLHKVGAPIVIKADGLAAGKGVVVASSLDDAFAAVRDMLSGNAFGASGERVVIEEFLAGEEASYICLCDGEHSVAFATSQDHKARDDGDVGPNTGGMGAYSPAPVVTDAIRARVEKEVIEPTLRGMAADGMPYQGFLYAGLMIMADGTPKVIEFNCRFGDPEAQVVLARLDDDLVAACQAALAGELAGKSLSFDPRPALGVVLAAGGYPFDYRKGDVINGLDAAGELASVLHAGTAEAGDDVVSNGGRVLCVVALGDDVASAQAKAYQAVDAISWTDVYCRRDIGHRAISRNPR